MLDGLLGRGFSSKCKSSIKLLRARLDVIRRKKSAVQKFLRKDIADLLTNGLDINAHGRTEGLLVELKLSYCYDFVEQSCQCILNHLSAMQKQSECPEECKVAVASLMFAAARFSDLPELRDLRHAFQERYGNTLELFVNQEFVENLSSKSPTLEKKLQIMEDIAKEFSIRWDSRAFEQKMSRPVPGQSQPRKYGPLEATADKYKPSISNDNVQRGELSNGHRFRNRREENGLKKDPDLQILGTEEGNRHRSRNRREDNVTIKELESSGHKQLNGREENVLKKDQHDISYQKRQLVISERHVKEDTTPRTMRLGSSSSHGKNLEKETGDAEFPPSYEGLSSKSDAKYIPLTGKVLVNLPNQTRIIHEKEEDTLKSSSNSLPPPYHKQDDKLKSSSNSLPPPYHKPPKPNKRGSSFDCNEGSSEPSVHKPPIPNKRGSSFDCNEGSSEPSVHNKASTDRPNHERVGDHEPVELLPKPRSVRRRHPRSASWTHDDANTSEDKRLIRRNPSNRRRGDSRRGLQILFDDDQNGLDEEERKLDKLLIHYSTKPTSFEPEKLRRKSKASRDDSVLPHPGRSVSLPNEQVPSEEKVFARAASFQSDRSNQAKHVHPKLPDYDDLAARFAALKGR